MTGTTDRVMGRGAEALGVFFLFMEIAWLAGLLDFLAHRFPELGRPSFAWFCLLYAAAYGLGRLARGGAWPARRQWVVGAALLAPAAFLSAKLVLLPRIPLADLPGLVAYIDPAGPVVFGVAAPALCLRGWIVGRARPGLPALIGAFQIGLVALLILAPLGGLVGLTPEGALPFAIAFLGAGLSGLALARFLQTRRESPDRAPVRGSVLAVAAIALVLVAAAGAAGWADRGLIDLLLEPLRWLWALVRAALDYLVTLLEPPEAVGVAPPPGGEVRLPPGREPGIRVETGWFRPLMRVLFLAGWAVILWLVLAANMRALLRWLRRREEGGAAPAREAADYGLKDDLRLLVAWILAVSHRLFAWLGFRRAAPAQPRETAGLRALYRGFQTWAAAQGWPRGAGQTPHEYLAVLCRVAPEHAAEFAVITEAYARARYGARAPEASVLDRARECWHRIVNGGPVPATKEAAT